jgi:ABC-type lipopolysaccharide export system ATPase subunit
MERNDDIVTKAMSQMAADRGLSAVKKAPDLVATGLVKIYGDRTVVNGMDVKCSCGEIVGLLGPNGAGKTTTFYMVVGLVKPDGGKVMFRGEDITSLPVFLRARKGLGYLAQEASIFRKLSVWDNVMAILQRLAAGEVLQSLSANDDRMTCGQLSETNAVSGNNQRLSALGANAPVGIYCYYCFHRNISYLYYK